MQLCGAWGHFSVHSRENVLRSDPKHHRAASDAYSVVTSLYRLAIEAVTINVLVSTKVLIVVVTE